MSACQLLLHILLWPKCLPICYPPATRLAIESASRVHTPLNPDILGFLLFSLSLSLRELFFLLLFFPLKRTPILTTLFRGLGIQG
ncbi:hypothetical protein I3842_13G133000 [Carya illinoinensis]|uniref:Secreted protein n=1 Tax=Carya illinoinensis TaxID=32201 RepID=A0A922DD33_CARIL|nr:hypothetical protein I3842_13G133000 [Carya illinoinensis]